MKVSQDEKEVLLAVEESLAKKTVGILFLKDEEFSSNRAGAAFPHKPGRRKPAPGTAGARERGRDLLIDHQEVRGDKQKTQAEI